MKKPKFSKYLKLNKFNTKNYQLKFLAFNIIKSLIVNCFIIICINIKAFIKKLKSIV